MGYSRSSGHRYSPRKDNATRNAREDMAKLFGEPFRFFDSYGVGRSVEVLRQQNNKIKPNDFFKAFNKSYNKHYRQNKK